MSDRRLVLVVDDDVDIREALIDVLEEEGGFRAVGACNGAEALQRLQGGLRPDLILLDLTMPVMDGPTFHRLQLADERIASIPVVVLSAYRHLAEELRPTVSRILAKPVDLKELVGTVREIAA